MAIEIYESGLFWTMIFIGIFLFVYLGIWVISLVDQIKRKRYYWFVFTLIFSITFIIYLLWKYIAKKGK